MRGSPVVLSRTVPMSVPCSGGGTGAAVGSWAHSTGAPAVIAVRHTNARARRTNIPRPPPRAVAHMRTTFREGYRSTKWTRSGEYVTRAQRARNDSSIHAANHFARILGASIVLAEPSLRVHLPVTRFC